MSYNPEPSYFETAEDLDANFVYNGFCGANLSKYMIEGSKLEGKTLVFLKPCDSYSFNQLIAEHRVDRDKAYIIGVGCMGKLSFEKIKEQGVKGITNITIDDANENITVETLYGEKTLAYKDCMLELPCLQGQGAPDFRRDHRREPRHKGRRPLCRGREDRSHEPGRKVRFLPE